MTPNFNHALRRGFDALDRLCAPGGTPIRLGDPNPYPVSCELLDAEWRARTRFSKSTWWASNNVAFRQPLGPNFEMRFFDLRDALVAFGGEEVCCPFGEANVDDLLARGQLWGGEFTSAPGRIGDAHTNVAELWAQNQDKYLIATGYGLSNDSLWRQHSWCIEVTPEGIRLLETSVPRLLYFGYVMHLHESHAFSQAQTGEKIAITTEAMRRYDAVPPA